MMSDEDERDIRSLLGSASPSDNSCVENSITSMMDTSLEYYICTIYEDSSAHGQEQQNHDAILKHFYHLHHLRESSGASLPPRFHQSALSTQPHSLNNSGELEGTITPSRYFSQGKFGFFQGDFGGNMPSFSKSPWQVKKSPCYTRAPQCLSTESKSICRFALVKAAGLRSP